MTTEINTKHRAGSVYVSIVADYMERLESALSDATAELETLRAKVKEYERKERLDKFYGKQKENPRSGDWWHK